MRHYRTGAGSGVGAAIARAAARLAGAPDVEAPSRYGAVALNARKVVLRALRHYDKLRKLLREPRRGRFSQVSKRRASSSLRSQLLSSFSLSRLAVGFACSRRQKR